MDAVEKMMGVVCVGVTEGQSGDGLIWRCVYDLRKGDLFTLYLELFDIASHACG